MELTRNILSNMDEAITHIKRVEETLLNTQKVIQSTNHISKDETNSQNKIQKQKYCAYHKFGNHYSKNC